MFIIRRHGSGHVVDEAGLIPCHLVKHAFFPQQFGHCAYNECPQHLRVAFRIDERLHTVPAADAPVGRKEMTQGFGQKARLEFLAAHGHPLGNRHHTFRRANHVVRSVLALSIFLHRFHDIIPGCQDTGGHRYNFIFHEYIHL